MRPSRSGTGPRDSVANENPHPVSATEFRLEGGPWAVACPRFVVYHPLQVYRNPVLAGGCPVRSPDSGVRLDSRKPHGAICCDAGAGEPDFRGVRGRSRKCWRNVAPAMNETDVLVLDREAVREMKKLFVGGLAWGTSSEALRAAFEKFGEVEDAVVMTDRETGRSRGFGFVTFKNPADGQRAMDEMNGQEFDGRAIKVDAATSKPRTGGGFGGGGG